MYISIELLLLFVAAIIAGYIILLKYNKSTVENDLKTFREIVAQLNFDKNLKEYDIAEDIIISNRVHKFVDSTGYRAKTYEGYRFGSIYILLLLDVLTYKFDALPYRLPIAYKVLETVKEKQMLPEELYKFELENIEEIDGRYKRYQHDLHKK